MAGVDSRIGKALIRTVQVGNVEQVHRLIENGDCVNAVDEHGKTALMIAIIWRLTPEMAISLIKGGTDINMQDKYGKTALMYAIEYRRDDIAAALISETKDFRVNSVDDQGPTILIKAFIEGMTKFAIALIKRGADINMKDELDKAALMYVLKQRRDDIAAAVISEISDFSVNRVDNQGQTALIRAAMYGMTKCAIALIKRGADVNVKDKYGTTALMYAIEYRSDDIAAALISETKNFSANTVGNQGRTALMYAIEYGRDDIATALISETKDFSINSVDDQGRTPLMKTSMKGMTNFALTLIKRGADINMKDEEGRTALMLSSIHGMTKFAITIIKYGADVNIKDKEGKTALMHAIELKNGDTALAIIGQKKDLDLNSVDNQGCTMLMKAIINDMNKTALEFGKNGADVNIKDKEGKTALTHAIECKHEDTSLAIIGDNTDLDLNSVDNLGQTALMKAIINHMNKTAVELIKNGADVNIKDEDGKTALMFIGLADSSLFVKELTFALINAGADVNITDYKGNTALMYNLKYKASVKALVEHDKALAESKNNLGRTALFFALVESISSAQILVENGANLESTDNYNVSVLSYWIHHCIKGKMPPKELMVETLTFSKENGITKKTIANAIINAALCKLFLVELNLPVETIAFLLSYAAEELSIFKRSERRLFNDLVLILRATGIASRRKNLLIALGKLLELGADLNTADEKGNTILHYITLFGIYDYRTGDAWECFLFLAKKGLKINQKNCDGETPLLFMLSNAVKHYGHKKLDMKYITKMCEFLVRKDPTLAKDTSQSGDSVFHLIIKLSTGKFYEENFEQLLQIFFQPQFKGRRTVNGINDEMNTPLHIWAASPIQSEEGKRRNRNASVKMTWQGRSEKILDHLLKFGAVLHARNIKGETPLHVCRTWSAVKLLVKSGATTNDIDATGRNPLLSAAQNSLFLENPGLFYPDISPSESPTFWKTVMDMGFSLWTCDKNGDSIISNLIMGNSFELADGMVGIACDSMKTLSDETLLGVLNAICKDNSAQTTWKSILVDKLLKQLKSTRRSLDMSLPLRSCCMNIVDHHVTNRIGSELKLNSVHYEIAKQLLRYGASGESCLDVAEGCPALHTLLSTPICLEERPFVIPWSSHSQKHKNQLAEVARGLNCNVEGPYWYHTIHIGHGAFGKVFAGIHEKDSMEIAIKRVQYSLQDREEDTREIRSFASITDCSYIVRYLAFFQTNDFSFIVLELMEGNLDEYFASTFYDHKESTKLCKDIALGLKYLHNERNIIHRDLKPGNILYKTHPQVCLKIADFGLSRRLDIHVTSTVIATGVGTRGWIAPEVIKSATHNYLMSSDVFSFGLILHYILSNQKHPFSPADCKGKSASQINTETESNILNHKMEGWDDSLDAEQSHLITGMLNCTNEKERPTASMLLDHPMFWSKKKKLDFLTAVGNQKEFECPRAKRTLPLTMAEQDLEKEFATIVKFGRWDDPRYTQTSGIFIEIQKPIVKHDKKGKAYTVPTRKYDIGSAVELVRFIRNAIAHVSEASRPAAIRTQILDDAVFLDEFPNLVIEVFKAMTSRGWDVSREEIKHVLANE